MGGVDGGVGKIGGGGNGGQVCEECGGISQTRGGGYCSADRQYFINGGNGRYQFNPSSPLGTCTWIECVPDFSSPTGETCTEYNEILTYSECSSKSNGTFEMLGETEFTTEEIYTDLINCFDYRHNEDRYNRDGAGTILFQNKPTKRFDVDYYEGPPLADVTANKGCGLGVVSNGHGRLSTCDEPQIMGTLLTHWQFGDASGTTPNAPKTPIKSCLLPKNWTPQDTIRFIDDHWQTIGNPSDRGPAQHPLKRNPSPFTFRKTDTNKKINYASRNSKVLQVTEENQIIYKLIKTIQNGKYIDICAPIFGMIEEYQNLPDCVNT